MANHSSAEKRHRQSIRRRDRNRAARLTLRAALKKARTAIEKKEPGAAELVLAAEKAMAKAATKGLVHKNNASRRVSRLRAAAVKSVAVTNK